MNKDEIWQKIKEDKTIIYGQSMLDVFLQTTESLSLVHYLETTNKQQDFIKNKQVLNSLFIESAAANRKDLVMDFIKKGVSDKSWGLKVAAEKGSLETAEFLLDLGVKDDHRSAVDAAMKNKANIIRLFIDRQVGELRYDDDELFTELCFISAAWGSVDVIKVLMDKINLYYDPALMGKSYVNNVIKNMIERAAENGHNKVIKLFLDKNINLSSALDDAAHHGHYKTVEFLLDNGAKDEQGIALEVAAKNGHYKTVRLLLSRQDYLPGQIYKALQQTPRLLSSRLIIDLLNKYLENS
jgi:ankyrin repeat protein